MRRNLSQSKEKAYAEAAQQAEAAKGEVEAKIAAIRQEITELSANEDVHKIQLQISQFFDVQIEEAKLQLKKITEEKYRLYSMNVIYPTYRELVAESSFYEYFSSGRCEALEGTHGAYNLFEAECRSDVIARVIRTVEEVKQGQIILHRQMSEIVELQRELESAQEKALPYIRKIGEDRLAAYMEENKKKGITAAAKEKPDSKETAVVKYFRILASSEEKIAKCIGDAQGF